MCTKFSYKSSYVFESLEPQHFENVDFVYLIDENQIYRMKQFGKRQIVVSSKATLLVKLSCFQPRY